MLGEIIKALSARKERKALMRKEKSEMIKTIDELNRLLEIQINEAVLKIEELEPGKLYYFKCDKSIHAAIRKAMSIIKDKILWTAPPILLTDHELKELTEKELLLLLEYQRNLKTEVKNHEKSSNL